MSLLSIAENGTSDKEIAAQRRPAPQAPLVANLVAGGPALAREGRISIAHFSSPTNDKEIAAQRRPAPQAPLPPNLVAGGREGRGCGGGAPAKREKAGGPGGRSPLGKVCDECRHGPLCVPDRSIGGVSWRLIVGAQSYVLSIFHVTLPRGTAASESAADADEKQRAVSPRSQSSPTYWQRH